MVGGDGHRIHIHTTSLQCTPPSPLVTETFRKGKEGGHRSLGQAQPIHPSIHPHFLFAALTSLPRRFSNQCRHHQLASWSADEMGTQTSHGDAPMLAAPPRDLICRQSLSNPNPNGNGRNDADAMPLVRVVPPPTPIQPKTRKGLPFANPDVDLLRLRLRLPSHFTGSIYSYY